MCGWLDRAVLNMQDEGANLIRLDIFLSVQTFQVFKTWKVYLRAKMSSRMVKSSIPDLDRSQMCRFRVKSRAFPNFCCALT